MCNGFNRLYLYGTLQDTSNKQSESTSNLYSGSSSPLTEANENSAENLKENSGIIVPAGWRLETDVENSCQCFINVVTGAKVCKILKIMIYKILIKSDEKTYN